MSWISLLTILAYGALHSILAGARLKNHFRRLAGDRIYHGFYRLLYNIVSAIMLIPVVWIVVTAPSSVLWRLPMPWAAVFLAMQLIALAALIIAVLQADPLRFAGLKQALAYLRHEPLPIPEEPLQVRGFYGLVRHPLYLFSLLVLWPTPVMTGSFLGFSIGATAYFVIGSRLEERRLAAEFGTAYTSYQRRVPWMLPWPRPRR